MDYLGLARAFMPVAFLLLLGSCTAWLLFQRTYALEREVDKALRDMAAQQGWPVCRETADYCQRYLITSRPPLAVVSISAWSLLLYLTVQ